MLLFDAFGAARSIYVFTVCVLYKVLQLSVVREKGTATGPQLTIFAHKNPLRA